MTENRSAGPREPAEPVEKGRPSPISRARRIGGRPTPRSSALASTVRSDEPVTSAPKPAPNPASTAAPEPGPNGAPSAASKTMPQKPARASQPAPNTASAPAEVASGRRGLPLRWIPATVLGLAVLALLAVLVISSHGVYWAKADSSASGHGVRQEQVLAAAKKCFAQINSYDYRRLDGLVAKDVACTTGAFTADLKRALTTQILKLAPKLKAVQTAQVNRAGISSVNRTGTQVVTLIYGQLAQSNSTTASKNPRLDVVGAVVTVDKVGSQWLISKVDTDVGNSLGS